MGSGSRDRRRGWDQDHVTSLLWDQSGFHPMKFWFSVVPTRRLTSLGYECAMGSPLDHSELDEGTSSEIDMSPRYEQGARVFKTSLRVNDVSSRSRQGARVPKASLRVNDISPRSGQCARVPKTSLRVNDISPRSGQCARVPKTSMRSSVLRSPVHVLRARHVY
uniref:Uncharacterized protein n=1 Tax=Lepeophtheirus salmonis TaxID=72036 RepID=A0A0K2VB49_LEPSM